MLEQYFATVDGRSDPRLVDCSGDRVYVAWLAEHSYSGRSVLRRVPLLVAFGEFARSAAPDR